MPERHSAGVAGRAGLLGLLAVAILARLLPDPVNRLWLGLDRRMHPPGG